MMACWKPLTMNTEKKSALHRKPLLRGNYPAGYSKDAPASLTLFDIFNE